MKSLITLLMGLVLSILACSVNAFPERSPLPLPNRINDSQVVVVASLEGYVPDSKSEKNIKKGMGDPFGEAGLIAQTLVKPAAHYKFHVLQEIKGHINENLQLDLPPIVGWYYKGNIIVEMGKQFLLFLHADGSGGWKTVDSIMPIVPIGKDVYLRRGATDEGPATRTISLLLLSLDEPVMRRVNTYLLRDVVDTRLPMALFPLLETSEVQVRENIAYCLSTNQYVKVIPVIAALQAELAQQNNGTDSISALQKFKIPAAIPYLNPLLFSWEEYTRINAIMTLQNLADYRSIPYLMLALFDPETQNVANYSAYRALHRLIPALGRPRDPAYFEARHEVETARVLKWWREELSGKHASRTLELHAIKTDVAALPLEQLHSLLFDPAAEPRQKVMLALQTRANASSIPYLILALQDPNTDVAYGAYTVLHRLIPKIKLTQTRVTFESQRNKVIEPLMNWWEDELLARHVKRPKQQK